MSDIVEPKCVEMTVSRGGGGKIAIVDYGRHTSDYSIFLSRKYVVPDDWTDEQVDEFQVAAQQHLFELIDPIDSAEMDGRLNHANWIEE